MAVGRPRVISAGCRAGPVGPCGRRTSLLRVHGPIIQVIFTASDDIPGGAIGSHMNFHGLIGATSSQKFGDWSFTNFSRRHSGGGHWDGVSFERKKNIQTSQPLRTSLCQPGLGDVVFWTTFRGGPLERLSWSMGCKPRNPCEHSLCQPRLGVGPASCSFLSERESEAGSSETTHFARGPCENHPCRYSCLCVSGGTKFRDTGR